MVFYGENLGVFLKENTVYVFLAEKSSNTKDGYTIVTNKM